MAKILVVDDNAASVTALAQVLELAGHDVIATSDPREAIALAASSQIDAAVLDVVMPEVSGYEVVQALRARLPTAEIPVVFVSGLDAAPDRVRGLREGADDYLVKPFDPGELTIRLERLLERAARHRGELSGPDREAGDLRAAFALLEERLRTGGPLTDIRLGRYQLLERIGDGATGTVFRSWDSKLHRPVAVKTFRLDAATFGASRQELVSGLLREAMTAARLNHPHIVAVYDILDTDEAAFIAMELVSGASLERYLRAGGPLPADQVIALGAAVCRALAAAHEHRVLHHDIKPGNILLGRDGTIKLSDFGIAVFLSSFATRSDHVFGTPGFLPPEFLLGGAYDEKGDLFAVGVTLYLCATGQPPFPGRSIQERVTATIATEPPPPRSLVPALPTELDAHISSLMARDRSRRPVSAAAAAQTLEAMARLRRARWQVDTAVLDSRVGEPADPFHLAQIPRSHSRPPGG